MSNDAARSRLGACLFILPLLVSSCGRQRSSTLEPRDKALANVNRTLKELNRRKVELERQIGGAKDGDQKRRLEAENDRVASSLAPLRNLSAKNIQISFGQPAAPSQFPFIVALLANAGLDPRLEQNCGGSIVSQNWILTAAHCLDNATEQSVLVFDGGNDLTSGAAPLVPQQFVRNPSYVPRQPHDDIALIRLSGSGTSKTVVKLDEGSQNLLGTTPEIAGWGFNELGERASTLRWALISIPSSGCPGSTSTLPNMLCAVGTGNTCTYDSGGPLVLGDGGSALLIGVTAGGVDDCSKRGGSGLYTKVAPYLKWIKDTMRTQPLTRMNLPKALSAVARKDRPDVPTTAPADSGRLLPISTGDESGFINTSGVVTIWPRFQRVGTFEEGLAPAWQVFPDELYPKVGYIDRTGAWAIKPQFEWGAPFHEGYARVHLSDKYGTKALVSRIGTIVRIADPVYDIGDVYSDRVVYSPDGYSFGFVDSAGKLVISTQFDAASPFHEGLARVEKTKAYGYIDLHGKVVIPLRYAVASDYHAGRAAVCELPRSRCGYLNLHGDFQPTINTLSRPWLFDQSLPLDYNEDGLHPYYDDESGKFGYVNDEGRIAIRPQFYNADDFSDGLAAVSLDQYSCCEYIDTHGKAVLSSLIGCEPFVKGIAGTTRRTSGPVTEFRYIDKRGRSIWTSSAFK